MKRLFLAVWMLGIATLALAQAQPPGPGGEKYVKALSQPTWMARPGVLDLRLTLRRLFTEHSVWKREYIVNTLADPDADLAVITGRLQQNADELSQALQPFIAASDAVRLRDMLRLHAVGAARAVNTAMAGQANARKQAQDAWQANANQLVDAFARVIPKLDKKRFQIQFNQRLESSKRQVTARLSQKWSEDADALTQEIGHGLSLADLLADGVVQQFPDRF